MTTCTLLYKHINPGWIYVLILANEAVMLICIYSPFTLANEESAYSHPVKEAFPFGFAD